MKRPSVADWQAALPRLKRAGGQLQGPCPACGGVDRFHVNLRDNLFGCRHGCSFQEILQAAGLWREPRRPAHSTPRAGRRIATRGDSGTYGGQSSVRDTHGQTRTEGAQSGDSRPLAASLWKLGRELQDTAAGTYLERRGVFLRPRTTRPCARWLTRDAAQQAAPGLPADADGAIAYRLRWPSSEPALQLDAITADSHVTEPRWRRSVGATAGKSMVAPGRRAWPLIVAEGPVDALALATWTGCSVLATCGTATMGNTRLHSAIARTLAGTTRTLVICADGNEPGRKAARVMLRALRRAGVERCGSQHAAEGSDPAAELDALLAINDRRRRMQSRWADALRIEEHTQIDPDHTWARGFLAWHRRLEQSLPLLAAVLRAETQTQGVNQ